MKPRDAFPPLIAELRDVAERLLANERSSHTLQPTALVNEAYLRFGQRDDLTFVDAKHFLATLTDAMQKILIDHARRKKRLKRGGGAHQINLDEISESEIAQHVSDWNDEQVQLLTDGLDKLGTTDPQMKHVIFLHVIGGLKMKDVAGLLGVSERKAWNDLKFGKARLMRDITNPT
jgi:RNA polymerase sigma-70 factor (ECF subfamily)